MAVVPAVGLQAGLLVVSYLVIQVTLTSGLMAMDGGSFSGPEGGLSGHKAGGITAAPRHTSSKVDRCIKVPDYAGTHI